VDLVAMSIVVTDDRDDLVTGLTAEDFTVFENGVAQEISFFSEAGVPLDLAILLDTSASMSGTLTVATTAALGLISILRPGDRVMVADIKDTMRMLYPMGRDFDRARSAIRNARAAGDTSLYSSLYIALHEMARERRDYDEVRRQAIAVLSDTVDTTSLVSFESVMAEARRRGIAVYSINMKPARRIEAIVNATRGQRRDDHAQRMRDLALETGAVAYFPRTINELPDAYSRIADELANQYSVGYTPRDADRDGRYRRLAVHVDAPRAKARVRAGYVAAPLEIGPPDRDELAARP
jgi:VWFA-related protein